MKELQHPIRMAVKRAQTETYLLISLAAFAGSVIGTRLFLQITGYPQFGNSVLHIAHALYGGLLLIVAALLPLVLANRWAFTLSALLSGLGIGLFIDEVGKFITQQNDYFYPAAAPLIYAFFLMLVLHYLFVRRQGKPDPRAELYRALSGLRELADNNLDAYELALLLKRLDLAKQSNLPHVAGLAAAISTYLDESEIPLVPVDPGIQRRAMTWFNHLGERLGRERHRLLIYLALILMSLGALTTIALMLYAALSPQATALEILIQLVSQSDIQDAGSFWLYLRLGLEFLVGVIALTAIYFFLLGDERQGVNVALYTFLLSLTVVLLLTIYLDQFSAFAVALIQLVGLLMILSYRRWYLSEAHE